MTNMIKTTKMTKAAAAMILVIMAYILLINILSGYCGFLAQTLCQWVGKAGMATAVS